MATPTRETLLSIVDDMELICRELLENLIAPKTRRMNAKDHEELTLLLIEKDASLRKTLELASEQGKIERQIRSVEEEVQKQDECIKALQKQFKDAENLLSTSIFQAKQKLNSISKAKETPVSSEELIKYGHRISASNAVCAPLNWQQGDSRRPYPTDLEMRLGFLGRPDSGASSSTPSSSSGATQGVPVHMRQGSTGAGGSGSSATPMHHHLHGGSMTPDFHMSSPSHFVHQSPNKMLNQQQGSNAGQMGWPGAGDVGLMKGEANSHLALEAKGGQQEDVEVMSTDSSSSSSTDSN